MTLGALETRLGYTFSQPGLLTQALTHRSFGQPHNERLEFLGDSVLNCAVAKLLFESHADLPEGELSRLRANLVNQSVLAEIAADLQLGALLRLGDGEHKTGGASRPSILADAVEAVLGGIFLDAGFAATEQVVNTLFASRASTAEAGKAVKDAKTSLQEMLQARRLALPQYAVQKIEGAAHRQVFFVRCEITSHHIVTEGQGATRRVAEQDAAARALASIAMAVSGPPS